MLTGLDVKAERVRFGLSQPDAAKIVDMPVHTYISVERKVINLTQEEYQRLVDLIRSASVAA